MGNRLMRRQGRETIGKRGTRKKRPKTFKTEEAAHAWAKNKGIPHYDLVNLRGPGSKIKKLRVVVKQAS